MQIVTTAGSSETGVCMWRVGSSPTSHPSSSAQADPWSVRMMRRSQIRQRCNAVLPSIRLVLPPQQQDDRPARTPEPPNEGFSTPPVEILALSAVGASVSGYAAGMGLVLLLLLLALVFGGVGLFVEALQWFLVIALILLIAGAFFGYRGRGRVGT